MSIKKFLPVLLILLWSCTNDPVVQTDTVTADNGTATMKFGAAASVQTLNIVPNPNDSIITLTVGHIPHVVIVPPVVTPPVDPPPVVVPPTAGYTTTYSNSYDKTSDLDNVHEQLGSGTISTATFKTGPGSFKGIVNVGDPSISSGFRSENQYMDASQNPKEGAVSYDWKLESLNPVSWGGDIAQWHPGGNDNGGSALFFMEAAQGMFNMYCWKKGYYTSYGNPDKITYNKWYRIRYEFLWSLKSDGYWKVYIDGKLYWSYSGATQISNDQPYLKIGWNFFSGSSNQKTSVHAGIAYWDNLLIEKKN